MSGRVVKFRAFHPKHGYAYDAQNTYDSQPWKGGNSYDSFGVLLADIENEGIVVEQFTGVTLSDGTDVYEGDVVIVDVLAGEGERARSNVRGPVKWVDNGFGIDLAGYARQWVKNIRVVGTIHTPEVRK